MLPALAFVAVVLHTRRDAGRAPDRRLRSAGQGDMHERTRGILAPATRMSGGAQYSLQWILEFVSLPGCRGFSPARRSLYYIRSERRAKGRVHRTPASAPLRSA